VSEETSEGSHLCGGFLDTSLYVSVVAQVGGEDGDQVQERVGERDIPVGNVKAFWDFVCLVLFFFCSGRCVVGVLLFVGYLGRVGGKYMAFVL